MLNRDDYSDNMIKVEIIHDSDEQVQESKESKQSRVSEPEQLSYDKIIKAMQDEISNLQKDSSLSKIKVNMLESKVTSCEQAIAEYNKIDGDLRFGALSFDSYNSLTSRKNVSPILAPINGTLAYTEIVDEEQQRKCCVIL